MNATEIQSVGSIAGELQTPVVRIIAAAEQLGIRPALILNHIRHYAADDVERIADRLREQEVNCR